jgi:hypothetical protein
LSSSSRDCITSKRTTQNSECRDQNAELPNSLTSGFWYLTSALSGFHCRPSPVARHHAQDGHPCSRPGLVYRVNRLVGQLRGAYSAPQSVRTCVRPARLRSSVASKRVYPASESHLVSLSR